MNDNVNYDLMAHRGGSETAPQDLPETPDLDERDRLIDAAREVTRRAVTEDAATWEHEFPEGNLGEVMGVSDAALVTAAALVDAGWRPAAPSEGDQK